MTGLAILRLDGDEMSLVTSAEIAWPDCVDACLAVIGNKQCDAVVAERFIINARTVANSQAPWSLMALGCLTWMVERYGYDLVLQSPGDAKKMAPNDRLRRLGTWHVGGAGHANDAIRHGVLYAIRHGFKSRLLLPPE